MEAVRTSETSVNTNMNTLRYIPEDSKLQFEYDTENKFGVLTTSHPYQ
jgi:hypothetical protein